MAIREFRVTWNSEVGTAFVQPAKVSLLNSFSAVGGWLAGGFLALYVNDFTPTPTSVMADFTPPAWTGYGTQEVDWGTAGGTTETGAEVIGVAPQWVSGSDADETVYGAYLLNEASTAVLCYCRFEEPIPVTGVEPILVPIILNFE